MLLGIEQADLRPPQEGPARNLLCIRHGQVRRFEDVFDFERRGDVFGPERGQVLVGERDGKARRLERLPQRCGLRRGFHDVGMGGLARAGHLADAPLEAFRLIERRLERGRQPPRQ